MDTLVRLLRLVLIDYGSITLVAALAAAAVYLLLPRPKPYPWLWGATAAGLALVLGGVFVVRAGRLDTEAVLFYAFSAVALIAGGLLLTQSNPARAALSFALVVLSSCGLFLLQAAPFLMAATTIIYAGAIVVTFLFIIMLAQQEGPSDADQRSREPLLACVTGFVLLGALLYVLSASYGTEEVDELIAVVRRARAEPSVDAMARALGGGESNEGFFKTMRQAIFKGGTTAKAHELAEIELDNLEFAWSDAVREQDAGKADKVLERLEEIALQARNVYGAFQPGADRPLSAFSGPPANQALTRSLRPEEDRPALRRDETGWPELPAENTAYLGRALFTDYLLAVELGGTLLLVATVGAIAIAGRRGEKRT